MAVQKELSCPHCKKSLPFGFGFDHDDQLNFICSHCSKIVFGVTPEAETEMKKHVASGVHSGSSVMGFHGGGGSRREPLPIKLTNIPDVPEHEETVTPTATVASPTTSSDSLDEPLDEWQCFV